MPVYITEFARYGRSSDGYKMPVPEEPRVANQTVAVGAGSVQSSAFNALTSVIRIHTDVICSIELGTNPTASATTRRMAANTTEYIAVPLNAAFKLAAITNT